MREAVERSLRLSDRGHDQAVEWHNPLRDAMKYRPHRGSLHKAMAEVVELQDRSELIAYLANDLGFQLDDADVRVEPYCYDDRIGWNTHIVTVRNKATPSGMRYFRSMGDDYFGAIGFTDGQA